MKEKQSMKSTRGLTLVALVIGVLASIPSPGWSQPKTGLESLYLPTYDLPGGGLGSCQYLRPFQNNGLYGIWIDYIPDEGEKIACQFDQPKAFREAGIWSCAYQTEKDFDNNGSYGTTIQKYDKTPVEPKNGNTSPTKRRRVITGFQKRGGATPELLALGIDIPSFISAPKIWAVKKDGTADYDRISTNQWDFGTTCRASGKRPNEIPAWSGSYYAIVNAGYPVRIDLSEVKGDSYVVSGFHERRKADGSAYRINFKSIPKVWKAPTWDPTGGLQNCDASTTDNSYFTQARFCMQNVTNTLQTGAPNELGIDFSLVKGALVATPLYPNYPSEDSLKFTQERDKVEKLTNEEIEVTIDKSIITKEKCKHPVAATNKGTKLTVTAEGRYSRPGTIVEFECRRDDDKALVKQGRVDTQKKASATFTFTKSGIYHCTATAVDKFHFAMADAEQVGSMRMFDANTDKPLRMYWDDSLLNNKGEPNRRIKNNKIVPVSGEGVIGPADAAPVCSGTDINARCWGNYEDNYGENSIGNTTLMDTWVFYPQSEAFKFTVNASEDPEKADTDKDGANDFEEGCGTGGNEDPNHSSTPDTDDTDSDKIPNEEEGKKVNDSVSRDTDGDGTPDYKDKDSDNDGIPDEIECRRDNKYSRPGNEKDSKYYRSVVPGEVNTKDEGCLDSDGDGYPDYIDLDSDNDGIPDAIECSNPKECEDTDGDGIPDYLDLDSDNDGIPDNVEAFISNGKIDASRLINPNDYDKVRFDPVREVAGLGPRVGMPQEVAKRRMITDISQLADSDGDGIPDFRDTDSDNDGVGDLTESKVNKISSGEGATTPGNWQGPKELGLPATAVKKASSEGSQNKDVEVLNFKAGDAVDANKNGIADKYENPAYNKPNNNSNNSNPKNIIQHRLDADKDGILDHVDPDLDNDGIPDIVERDIEGILPGPRIKDPVTGEMVLDSDGDGIPNYLDVDSDNDGIPDSVECTYSPSHTRDTVDNQSGYVLGCQDSDQGIKTPNALGGGKGDGLPDYLDKDSDDDGILDNIEALRIAPVHSHDFHYPNKVIDPTKTGKDVPIKKGSAQTPDQLIGKTLDDLKGNGAPVDLNEAVITISALDDHLAQERDRVADSDGDGIPDYRDFDSDNDGIPDAYEAYQETPNATQPPTKGIEPSGKDENHNGVDDAFDPACEKDDRCKASWSGKLPMALPGGSVKTKTQAPIRTNGKNSYPNYINPDVPTDNGGKFPALSPADDVNHNGVVDNNDPALCTQIPCKQEDLDNLDSDGDGIPDSVEKVKKGEGLAKLYGKDVPTACIPPLVKGVVKCDEYLDTDGDGIPNFLDKDSDNDGIPDSEECTYKKEYKDSIPSSASATPTEYVGGCINTDWNLTKGQGTRDHFPDYLDNDSDGDGVTDNNEAFDYDNDGLADPGFVVPPGTKDVDDNGVPNAVKPGLATEKGKKLADADGDGTPNHIDPDSNGDGTLDVNQAYNPKITPSYNDANNNGVDDAFDFACNGTDCPIPTATNGQKIKESPVTTFGPDGTPRKDPNTVAKAFEPHKSANGKTATYVDKTGSGSSSDNNGVNPDIDVNIHNEIGFVAGGCSSTPSEAPQSLWLLLVGAGLAFFRRRKKK